MKGVFITLEGPDGSGKSTQIKLLEEYLRNKKYKVILTREPGGTKIGEQIRKIILDINNVEMDNITETLLYAASRAQHVSEIIMPAIEKGNIVICDRFVDSSLVYQGVGRGLGKIVETINDIAIRDCMPDITFLFKINPEIGLSRTMESGNLDRLELENIEYHNRVYNAYLELQKRYPDRIKGIDATKPLEEIHQEIVYYIENILKDL